MIILYEATAIKKTGKYTVYERLHWRREHIARYSICEGSLQVKECRTKREVKAYLRRNT